MKVMIRGGKVIDMDAQGKVPDINAQVRKKALENLRTLLKLGATNIECYDLMYSVLDTFEVPDNTNPNWVANVLLGFIGLGDIDLIFPEHPSWNRHLWLI